MENEERLYIEDANKRKLFYRFTPAAIASQFVPLIVILHDEECAGAHHFEYKMWNVLTPIYNVKGDNRSTCWLGEKGDFFVKDLLQDLIKKVSQEYECEEHIYLFGNGMGGYGAILHGMLCKANAVYTHAPKIRLTKIETVENDLSNFLNASDSFPIFYLCDSVGSEENTLEEDTAYFVDACKKYGIKFDLDHCVSPQEDEIKTLKKVLNMLERMTPEA